MFLSMSLHLIVFVISVSIVFRVRISIKQQMRDYPVTAPVTADIKKLLKEFDLK